MDLKLIYIYTNFAPGLKKKMPLNCSKLYVYNLSPLKFKYQNEDKQ